MTFRKLLVILTIVVTAIIIMLLGTSYAWYQFDNAVTTFTDVQTLRENIDLAVVFTNDSNINMPIGVPILASEVADLSEKTAFTMTPSSEILQGKEVAYQISLINLEIDEALTSTTDLKYSLLEKIGNGTTTTIASGSFYNVTSNTLVLKEMTTITTFDTTYAYEFRLWLEDNGCTIEQINDPNDSCTNQNDLMGKSISGKIKVSAAFR